MKWLLSIAVVGGTALPLAAFPRPADSGRIVRECVESLQAGPDEARQRALDRLKALGPKGAAAIPALIRYLRLAPPRDQARTAEVLALYGPAARDAIPVLAHLLRQRPGPGPFLVDACVVAIPALGEPANPDLIRAALANSSEGRRRGGASLQPLLDQHPDAVAPALIEYLTDPSPRIQGRASQLLARSAIPRGEQPAPLAAASAATRAHVVAAARGALASPFDAVRGSAVALLLDLDPAALPGVMPLLVGLVREGSAHLAAAALTRRGTAGARATIALLHEPDESTRLALTEVLADFPAAARPALAEGLRHPDPVVRAHVLLALQQNMAAATDLRGPVLMRLADEAPAVRFRAAVLIARQGAARSAPALPVLIEAAFDRDPKTRRTALDALANLGKYARPVVPALLRRARTGDLDTRFAAAYALSKVDPGTWRTFVPVAIESFREPIAFYSDDRPFVVLRDAGPNARAALPVLREYMADDLDTVSVLAAEAVARIDPDNADALARLVTFLHWTDEEGFRFPFRDHTVEAVRRLGPLARPCGPALLEILPTCRRPREASRVALAALAVDPAATPALERFRTALKKDGNRLTEFHVVLDQLGPATVELLPDLIAALVGKDADIRGTIVSTLRNLGPAARSALPALRDLERTETDKEHVRKAISAIEGKPKGP